MSERRQILVVTLFVLLVLIQAQVSSAKKKTAPPRTAYELAEQMTGEFQRHNYRQVISLYTDFNDNYPDLFIPLVSRVLLSQSLANLGEIEDAITSLQETIEALPSQVDPIRLLYDLGNLLFLERRYEESEEIFQKMLLRDLKNRELIMKARDRIAQIKAKSSMEKRKDHLSLQLLDIEIALDSSDVPDGASQFLDQIIAQKGPESQIQRAKKLKVRIQELRTQKAEAMLDEARRLFDQDKKYPEVLDILNTLSEDYSDVADMTSVEALRKACEQRIR